MDKTEILIENEFEEKVENGRDIYKRVSYVRITLDDKLGNSDEWRNKVIKRIDGSYKQDSW